MALCSHRMKTHFRVPTLRKDATNQDAYNTVRPHFQQWGRQTLEGNSATATQLSIGPSGVGKTHTQLKRDDHGCNGIVHCALTDLLQLRVRLLAFRHVETRLRA